MKCRPTIVHLFALAFVHFVHNLGMKCKMWHRRLCICPIMTINDRKCRREGDVEVYKPYASSELTPALFIPVELGLVSVLKPSRGGAAAWNGRLFHLNIRLYDVRNQQK